MSTGSDSPAFTLRSVRRRLLQGSAWVFGARIGTLVLGLAISFLLTHTLTESEVGDYLSAATMAFLGGAVAQLGLDRATVRFAASAIGVDQPGRARAAIRIALGYGTIGALLVAAIVMLGLGRFLAEEVFDSPRLASMVPAVAGWTVALALQGLFVESFRGLQRFGAATMLDQVFTNAVSSIAFGIVWITRADVGPAFLAVLTASGVALAVGVAAILMLRLLRGLRGAGDLTRVEMFKVARPLWVTNLAILMLGAGIDLLILNAFEPSDVVGQYGVAARLVTFVVAPFVIFSGVIPPIIAELHTQGKMRQLEKALRAGATLAGLPALGVLVVFLLAGPWILGTFNGSEYRDAYPVLAILSCGRLYAVWAGSAGVTLMMTGHQRAMMTITLVSGTVSVTGGILAAAAFGAVGIASVTAASQVLQNTMQLTLVKRRLGIWTPLHLDPRELYRYLRPHGRRGEAAEDAAEAVAEVLIDVESDPDDDQDPGSSKGQTSSP
ncbi:MAG: oligosaccharide flippase family protein [Actinomycetota bacterium]